MMFSRDGPGRYSSTRERRSKWVPLQRTSWQPSWDKGVCGRNNRFSNSPKSQRAFCSIPKHLRLMNPVFAEFIGTTMLVIFGNGVVANVVLAKTKGNNGGWIVIATGWALAVFVGVFASQAFSGAHLNPAVTIAMAQAGKFAWADVGGYILAQMSGGIIGATLVFLFYREHFKASADGDSKLACFCTAPNIRNLGQALFCEALGT